MTFSFPTIPVVPVSFLNIRLLYLLFCVMAGTYTGFRYSSSPWPNLASDLIFGGTIGFVCGFLGLWLAKQLEACSSTLLIGGSWGIMAGMGGSSLFILGAGLPHPEIPAFLTPWGLLLAVLLCPYIGMVVGIQIADKLAPSSLTRPPSNNTFLFSRTSSHSIEKILDSSAIIDGRILPLCATGFLEGPLMIPQVVLHELHALADSAQLNKRTKGKRGLDILSQLQQLPQLEVKILNDEKQAGLTVDHQLIALAKTYEAKIVTNDWNLAKIASVQGVSSLNVNELTYQLRPLILPGEIIRVFIHKEGQGNGQGIAHLDDGTMVVIDDGAVLVGQVVEVVVTRFMQTHTGRMIFSSPHIHHSSLQLDPNPLFAN